LWSEWNPSGEKGYVFSPLVVDRKLILWYSDGVSLADQPFPDPEKEMEKFQVLCRALDPASGKLLWEYRAWHRPTSRRGEGQTPAVARFGSENCIVVTANAELKALRVRDGTEAWAFPCPEPRSRGTTIPTPLVAGRYIVNIPDIDATHAVEVDREHPDFPTRTAWTSNLDVFTPIHQFRHHDGYLYGFAGKIQGVNEQAASDSTLNLVCLELATGKPVWQQPGFKTGVSLTLADGLLFVRSFQTLRLVEATPTCYRLLGEVHTHDVHKPTLNLVDFVQPVLAHGRLLVRTSDELICYAANK
jgi:outer membrane protein assembly factor BamB